MKKKQAKKILRDFLNNGVEQTELLKSAISSVLKEKPRIDFSILNDKDWFFAECNGFKGVGKFSVKSNNLHYSVVKYDGHPTLWFNWMMCLTSEVLELRPATKQEIRELYETNPSLIPEDFTDWWVGQKVWDVFKGEGVITSINNENAYKLTMETKKGISTTYSEQGLFLEGDKIRSIYPYPVKIIKA